MPASNTKGLEKILTELRKRRRTVDDRHSEVRVGYSAPYAVFVHERLNAHYTVGQAKYLEQPMRTETPIMAEIIRNKLRAGTSLKEAHLDAAKHLMKVSLQLTPMKTGRLRASWFII